MFWKWTSCGSSGPPSSEWVKSDPKAQSESSHVRSLRENGDLISYCPSKYEKLKTHQSNNDGCNKSVDRQLDSIAQIIPPLGRSDSGYTQFLQKTLFSLIQNVKKRFNNRMI
ncbi:hypothetical protein AVEN_102609-1 [Araneus ventricosus]|uniref:Uncharacterized protein n=1 Tax=Araneus ventricosus TaxID=182803 RepID=A0A4Y2BIH0_ARAVE|nr:hypothetical protein AVEN_102609-1 [Araneus ventricosus]